MPKHRTAATLLALFACATLACGETPSETTPDVEDEDPPVEPAEPHADLIFRGGPILTIEDGIAEALAVTDNEIVAVGDVAAVMAHAVETTRIVELNGAALLPGFIDGHSHMINNAGNQGFSAAEAVDVALRYGLTTLAALAESDVSIDSYMQLEAAGDLGLRLLAYGAYNLARPDEDGGSIYFGAWFPANPPLLDDDRLLRIPGVKIFVDGAIGGSGNRGCYALREPYPESYQNDPNYVCPNPLGSLFLDAAELADVIEQAENAGFQVGMHAVGDRAIDTVLDALEEVRSRTGNTQPRHQIHHGHFLQPDQIPRYQELDVPFSVFAQFHTCDQDDVYPHHFGERYVLWANKFALAATGARAFIESDFGWQSNPDDDRFYNRPIDPFVALWTLATHRENRLGVICEPGAWLADHPVDIETGLRMHTINAAWAHGVDHLVGSLRVGKRADLVIASGDPTAGSADDLLDLRVLMTMVDGNLEYCVDDCPVPVTSALAD